MRIYFSEYSYPKELIEPYFSIPNKDNAERQSMTNLPLHEDEIGKFSVKQVGYLFISNDKYSGPVFILPKDFLMQEEGNPKRRTVLGKQGIIPEKVIDTEDPENILAQSDKYDYFLPELSLWLFRAIARYREDSHKEKDEAAENDIFYITPDEGTSNKDFLGTAVRLMDFLSDHRNLFTQISIINHSGNARTDWHKTIRTQAFVQNNKPIYPHPCIKDKTINIDEELIVIYYSVLKFLKEKYHFPINIDFTEVPYELKTTRDIQRYLDTGTGQKRLRDIKPKYYRDDLKALWSLLDSFFTFNTSKDNNKPLREVLVVSDFEKVFERMIDHIIAEPNELKSLKNQKDGKLIDHIYRDRSLIGSDTNIYFIGDSKYYIDGGHPTGEALYKQYTYARNVLQQHITQLYIEGKDNPNALRYRDTVTEGYNIAPNFFIRCHVVKNENSFYQPDFHQTEWKPKTNIHFEDRLFDRDTLILSEFTINLLYVIASYGSYEDQQKPLRRTIREGMIEMLNNKYKFYKFEPSPFVEFYNSDMELISLPFHEFYSHLLSGKAYCPYDNTIPDATCDTILAFEKDSPTGNADYTKVRSAISSHIETGSLDTSFELPKD